MKRIRLFILLIIVCPFICQLFGQTTFAFTYDDSGNRTARTILLLKRAITANSETELQMPEYKHEQIEENIGSSIVKIYPNPTDGLLNIELHNKNGQKTFIRLYNVNGKMLIDKIVYDQNTVIDLSEQPAGIYILNVTIENKTMEWKIIKD